MANFKIGSTDYSDYVKGLSVSYETLLSKKGGRNANGDMVLDILSRKRVIEVEIRPTNHTEMAALLSALYPFMVTISYRDPKTNTLVTGVECVIDTPVPQYYTIQNGQKVLYQQLSLVFRER